MSPIASPTAHPRRPNAIPIGKMCAKSRESRLRFAAEAEVDRIVQDYLREREHRQKKDHQDMTLQLQRRSNTPRRIKLVISRHSSRGSSQASSQGSSP